MILSLDTNSLRVSAWVLLVSKRAWAPTLCNTGAVMRDTLEMFKNHVVLMIVRKTIRVTSRAGGDEVDYLSRVYRLGHDGEAMAVGRSLEQLRCDAMA